MTQCDDLWVASLQLSFLDWPSRNDHAIVVYFEGCNHGCDGCQSPTLKETRPEHKTTVSELARQIDREAARGRTNKVVFSGGDPLWLSLRINHLIGLLKKRGLQVCIYTGYDFKTASKLVSGYRFIKTGKYERKLSQTSQKTDDKFILASSNQEIHDHLGNCLTKDGILTF